MKRRHLVELEDLSWWPRLFRDASTDYLVTAIRCGKVYDGHAPRLAAAIKQTGAERIVDLCSGAGGPCHRPAGSPLPEPYLIGIPVR